MGSGMVDNILVDVLSAIGFALHFLVALSCSISVSFLCIRLAGCILCLV